MTHSTWDAGVLPRTIDNQARRRLGPKWPIIRVMAALLALVGCGAITESENTLPEDVVDPVDVRTPEGALAAYEGVHVKFGRTFGGLEPVEVGASGDDRGRQGGVVVPVALLTDEFGSSQSGAPTFGEPTGLDRRRLPEGVARDEFSYSYGVYAYGALHRVRGEAREAIGLLSTYAPQSSPALRGHLFALAGYAEVLLADLFCSGIPLSTLDFDGDFTLQPGSTTADVYEHALALFDTAITLAADSAQFLRLAEVGRGRALLALGRFAEAAQAVASVADGFSYAVQPTGSNSGTRNFMGIFFDNVAISGDAHAGVTMTDREGGRGLDYRSSGDPRVAAVLVGNNKWNFPIYAPAKYNLDGSSPIVLADWVEARLIEAEAALHAGDVGTWLAKLNYLRQRASTVNSTWPALADTTDPGSDAGRVDLTFRERAFWLFLTGHRQGDLRRLIRQYGRQPESVYATGSYPGGFGRYGSDITLPVPPAERERNPQYTGCIHREA